MKKIIKKVGFYFLLFVMALSSLAFTGCQEEQEEIKDFYIVVTDNIGNTYSFKEEQEIYVQYEMQNTTLLFTQQAYYYDDILLGGETELVNGAAKYRFARCEHRECRIFVQQQNGIISAHEEQPQNMKYRRRFYIKGLKDATIYYFPEKYCDRFMAATDVRSLRTPTLDENWVPIYDEVMGYGFKGEHKDGKLSFLMPLKKYL